MPDRRALIAGNWKMYKTPSEAAETAGSLVRLVQDIRDIDIMVAPAYPALDAVAQHLKGSNVDLGAQNVFWEPEGAYTGEVASGMLRAVGCTYVIIGHSERRQYFGETDESVNKRIGSALGVGLKPVLCVGETEAQRDAGDTFSVLDKQVKNGLRNLGSDELSSLVIAYEPVWAIGTGKTATREQAQEAHQFIRSLLEKQFGSSFAGSTRILYGGSVKPANISELMAMTDIDGALVGGASLSAESFSSIVHYQG
jgi:triosephosphate isomerase